MQKLSHHIVIHVSFDPINTSSLPLLYGGQGISHFRGVRSILSSLFHVKWKILLANTVDPDQTPHYVVSDLGLYCLSMTLLQVSW